MRFTNINRKLLLFFFFLYIFFIHCAIYWLLFWAHSHSAFLQKSEKPVFKSEKRASSVPFLKSVWDNMLLHFKGVVTCDLKIATPLVIDEILLVCSFEKKWPNSCIYIYVLVCKALIILAVMDPEGFPSRKSV